MQSEILTHFYLVGGTALSLWLGHRKSIDIDLFTHHNFDSQEIAFFLERNLKAQQIETGKNLVRCYISNIKIELISHQYPLIKNLVQKNKFRIAAIEDICAFKLNAVVNRGTKKDFWDVAYLLNKFELNEIISFYKQKYKNNNFWQVEKSLCYFKDADDEATDILDFQNLSWDTVKNRIKLASKKSF